MKTPIKNHINFNYTMLRDNLICNWHNENVMDSYISLTNNGNLDLLLNELPWNNIKSFTFNVIDEKS